MRELEAIDGLTRHHCPWPVGTSQSLFDEDFTLLTVIVFVSWCIAYSRAAACIAYKTGIALRWDLPLP